MSNTITIEFEEQTFEIEQELLQSYYENAAQFLRAKDRAVDQFKAEVEAFAETTKLPKGFVTNLFTLTYQDKIATEEARVEALSTLSEAIDRHA